MIMRDVPLIQHLYDRVNVTMSFPSEFKNDVVTKFSILEPLVDYDIDISKSKKRRSLDANAYAWVLIGMLATAYKLTPVEVYKRQMENMPTYTILCVQEKAKDSFKQKWESHGIGWFTEEFDSKIDGCVNIKAHYGSSAYSTTEMSQLIDNLLQECRIANIPTTNEHDIMLALEEWK